MWRELVILGYIPEHPVKNDRADSMFLIQYLYYSKT